MIVKTFSATQAKHRDSLGDRVTQWIRESGVIVKDKVVTQSSDDQYHCLTITLFCESRED